MTPARDPLLSTAGLTEFSDAVAPEGESPYVDGAGPSLDVRVVESDPEWPLHAEVEMTRIREALRSAVLSLEHVGSTAVPGLPAKPVLDLDLLVADPDDETSYASQLQAAGYVLVVREPWWYRHRMFRRTDPAVNLHVYGPESAESARQRLFRDRLRAHPEDRGRDAAAQLGAAVESAPAGEHVQDHDLRKQAVLREIHGRLFRHVGPHRRRRRHRWIGRSRRGLLRLSRSPRSPPRRSASS